MNLNRGAQSVTSGCLCQLHALESIGDWMKHFEQPHSRQVPATICTEFWATWSNTW